MIAFAALAASLVLAAQAFAGSDRVGAVFAAACFDDEAVALRVRARGGAILNEEIPRIAELRTLAERLSPGLAPALAGETPEGYVERVRRRMKLSVPDLAVFIGEGLAELSGETTNIRRLHFALKPAAPEAEAAALLANEPRCVPAVIARLREIESERVLHLDRRLFEKLSVAGQATLLLHAAIQPRFFDDETSSWDTDQLVARMIRADGGSTSAFRAEAQGRDLFTFELYEVHSYPAVLADQLLRRLGARGQAVWLEGTRLSLDPGTIAERVKSALRETFATEQALFRGDEGADGETWSQRMRSMPLLISYVETFIDELTLVARGSHPSWRFEEYDEEPNFRWNARSEAEALTGDFPLPPMPEGVSR